MRILIWEMRILYKISVFIVKQELNNIEFDEKYLIFDARAAVQQARKTGINVYAVVVDSQAESYAETIFGWGNYRILHRAQSLQDDIINIYARLSWR